MGVHKMKKRPLIAVLDSGIDSTFYDLSQNVVMSKGFRMDEKGLVEEKEDLTVSVPHGTIIACIIKHFCKDVNFINVNILDENLGCNGTLLLHAIDDVLRFRPDIIHLSLGTENHEYIDDFMDLIKKVQGLDSLIVAANHVEGKKSYPSCLPGIIAVNGAWFDSLQKYEYKEGSFVAPFGFEGIGGLEEFWRYKPEATSFSAAYITGHLAALQYKTQTEGGAQLLKAFKSELE
jgi:hypothetical protein